MQLALGGTDADCFIELGAESGSGTNFPATIATRMASTGAIIFGHVAATWAQPQYRIRGCRIAKLADTRNYDDTDDADAR